MASELCRADRAKQFMPFAALKGYPEALHKKEKVIVPKAILSEDYKEELDQKLKQISERDIISVIYFTITNISPSPEWLRRSVKPHTRYGL